MATVAVVAIALLVLQSTTKTGTDGRFTQRVIADVEELTETVDVDPK